MQSIDKQLSDARKNEGLLVRDLNSSKEHLKKAEKDYKENCDIMARHAPIQKGDVLVIDTRQYGPDDNGHGLVDTMMYEVLNVEYDSRRTAEEEFLYGFRFTISTYDPLDTFKDPSSTCLTHKDLENIITILQPR